MKKVLFLCLFAVIFTVDIDAAVKYLVAHAHKYSVHLCAGYVANALSHGGFKFKKQAAAYLYRTKHILEGIGYKEIKKPASFKKGDITITEKNAYHIYGHMAMYTGKKWVSDFVQNSEKVYSSHQPPIHYYRYQGK